jgi:Tfp pilus assembly protein PilN
MNRISINLSPQKEAVSGSIIQNLIAYTPLAGLVAGVIFVTIVLLQIFIAIQMGTYKGYAGEWKQWESKAISMKAMKADMASLESELRRLEEIATPKYEFASILRDMFDSLPKNIWLESLKFKEDVIDLEGYVVKWNEDFLVSLDGFIDALREKSYFSSKFSDISIKASQKTMYNGVGVLDFNLECKN